MNGNWINKSNIDFEQWDRLVLSSKNASIFVYSFYLNAVAEDWEAFIADDFSFAIPVGTVRKGKLIRVYPPLFQGFMEPIGDLSKIDWDIFEHLLQERYKKGNLLLKSDVFRQLKKEEFVFQTVDKENFKLKTLAKRKIKQFEKTTLQLIEEKPDTQELSQFIARKLSDKVEIFEHKEVAFFYRLIKNVEKAGCLFKIGVYQGNELKGGILGFQTKDTLLYFKGAVDADCEKEGAMYALMNRFVEYGVGKNLFINFGGSRIEGVRYFYQRFNGQDVTYYHYSWDHSPLWFQIGFSIYSKLKPFLRK